ncbi:PEP-CTERM sorting domain-containing protein [Sulfuriroseicoccus oceanibius]|uniref:PEP-CTERM sorting domain-containing protein n=1 Tax=Sulfuriroseicoccus oceanibius TaxID=2707525 RepID=A0A6B3L5F8_9BACT|nr:PEP-CTERM sorting domain-containing protein [Sulfuriroseicoccus oceanibius]QQL45089.1 PEP-CTERM sorting domain-containing protein [Sulfuriroseicoccus oceanibius]
MKMSVLLALALVVAVSGVQAGTIFGSATAPDEQIVLGQALSGAVGSVDRTTTNRYRKMGQTIESTALDGDEVNISALYVQVQTGNVIPVSGTHVVELWVGEWDIVNNTAGATLVQEQYDVSGLTFEDGFFYGLNFTNPFSLDQNKDYAFQLWWTTDDPSHVVQLARANGQGAGIDGGFIYDTSTATDFPFDAVPAPNQDLVFYVQSVPEPSSAVLMGMGALALVMNRRR